MAEQRILHPEDGPAPYTREELLKLRPDLVGDEEAIAFLLDASAVFPRAPELPKMEIL